MITNLEEAIEHAKEVAEENREIAKDMRDCNEEESNACLECAEDHEQLANWLTELKERREADRWIPVSERLPEESEGIDYTKEFPDLIVFKDTPKQELGENLPQHMPLKYKPLKFPKDGFMAKYGTRNSERLGE